MYSSIPFRTGDSQYLARELVERLNSHTIRFDAVKLDHPDQLVPDNILAVHFADAGAQGEGGAVKILYVSPDGVEILHGNYAYGDLDLDAVIRKLPMLACLDSRHCIEPPYPFGGRLEVPAGWGYQYMGAMNHFFASERIFTQSKPFLVAFLRQGGGSWQIFNAAAWFYRAKTIR